MVSSSPDRNTFQLENYVKRQEEAGKLPAPEYLDMFKTWREQAQDNMEMDMETNGEYEM